MNRITEIEKAVPNLSRDELAKLEELIRKVRREKDGAHRPSLRDIAPLNVGKILQPLGTRDQWYDEMREESA